MFNGNEGEIITYEEAKIYTHRYTKSAPKNAIRANSLGKANLNKILSQNDCIGIRFYYAKTEEDKMTLVAVGYNSDGDDLIDGIILERADPCPPFCAPNDMFK